MDIKINTAVRKQTLQRIAAHVNRITNANIEVITKHRNTLPAIKISLRVPQVVEEIRRFLIQLANGPYSKEVKYSWVCCTYELIDEIVTEIESTTLPRFRERYRIVNRRVESLIDCIGLCIKVNTKDHYRSLYDRVRSIKNLLDDVCDQFIKLLDQKLRR